MNIEITGKHLQITDPIKNHIEQKFKKLQKYGNDLIKVHVVLETTNNKSNKFKAEADVNIPHHKLFAKHESNDMYVSIDSLVSKLEAQLSKIKQKNVSH